MAPWLVAALLSGGGALLNYKIQNDAIKAQNAENQRAMAIEAANREAERTRQLAMEKLQAQEVARALTGADPAQRAAEIEAQAEAPDNEFVHSAETYNIPTLQGQKGGTAVSGDIGRLVASALARTKDMLKAQSILSAQGVGAQGVQDDLMRMGSDISTIGGHRQGSMNVSRMETSIPAARVTPSSSPIGDLLMLGGQLYGGFGGFGGFGGGPMVAPGTVGMVTPQAAAGSIFAAPSSGAFRLPAVY